MLVQQCVGEMRCTLKEENSKLSGHFTRRVVLNCCAVIVGIAMAVVVCCRVVNMADWIGRCVSVL